MAYDMAALKAKLAARAAAPIKENENVQQVTGVGGKTQSTDVVSSVNTELSTISSAVQVAEVSVPAVLGTAITSEIDHLDFLAKMNKLAEAIHTKHPTMPVLLMQIHKQLRADPELVTTLDEDAIGIIVSGLQIHTKTELVSVVVKESKSKAKKIAVTLDML